MPEINYTRGAFIAYEPGPQDPTAQRAVPFRFNPESLSRNFQIEQGQSGSGTQGAPKTQPRRGQQGQAADATSGTIRQSFSVQVRFDFADRHESARSLDPDLGILPELSALEGLMYPASSPNDAHRDASTPVQARQQCPPVLFVWGPKRVLPVRITGMTINETYFNANLNATRAEVEVQLEVVGAADAMGNVTVGNALAFTERKRAEMADMFLATAASQTTRSPNLAPSRTP